MSEQTNDNRAIETLPNAFSRHRVVLDDQGNPVDYIFLTVNAAFEAMTGLKREKILGRRVTEVLPGIEKSEFDWIGVYGKVAQDGTSLNFEQFSEPLNRWYDVQVYSEEQGHFTTVFNEATSRKEEQTSLRSLLELTEKLIGSDLATFDYQAAVNSLLKLSGARFAAINTYEEDRTKTVTRAIAGLPAMIERATELLGFEITGQAWDILPERLRTVEGGKLVHFQNLYESSMGAINKNTASMLQKIAGIGAVYVLELAYGGRETIGDIIFFIPKGKEIKNREAIELYAGQISSILARLRSEQAYHLKSEELDRYFNNSLDLLCVANTKGEFVRINERWSEILGYSTVELEGRPFLDFVHPEDIASTLEAMATLDAQLEIISFKNRYLCSDGSYRWIEWRSKSQGKIIYAVARDVTEQQKAETALQESEQKYRSLTDNLPEVAYRCLNDKDWTMQYMSTAIDNITGYPPGEFINNKVRSYESVIHHEDSEMVAREIEAAIKAQSPWDIEYRVMHRDGTVRWVRDNGQAVVNKQGSFDYLDGLILDISDRKEAEDLKDFQLAFQQIAAETSAALLGTEDEAALDHGINSALQKLGELFGSDRGYLFQFSADLELMSNTHEWCAPGVVAQIERIQNQPTGDLPWWKEQVIKKMPFQIPDVSALPQEAEAEKHEFSSQGIRSLICLPTVGARGHMTGFIGFDMVKKPYTWPQEQITMLQLVADTIGGALERKRAEEALAQSLAFEAMIARVSSNFLNLPPEQIDEGINFALQSVGEHFNVDRSYLYSFSEDGETYSNTHLWCKDGIEGYFEKNQNYPVELTPWWAGELKSGRIVNIENVAEMGEEAALDRADFLSEEIKSIYTMPLILEGKVFGCFGFDTVFEHWVWTAEQIDLLQVVAGIITGAIARHKADRQIRNLSFHDQLTGIYNRRYFELEVARLDRSREHPIAVISADLDGLKLINDTIGHSEGDHYLQAGAEVLKSALRASDILARVGGDEFALLLPRTDRAAAELLVNRIRRKINEYNLEQTDLPLSISLGLAVSESADYPLKETYRMADNSMYTDKLQQGKKARAEIVSSLLASLFKRGNLAEGESDQVQELAIRLGQTLKLPEDNLARLALLAQVYDLGKVGLPDSIIHNSMQSKAGSLSDAEREALHRHPEIGYRIASSSPDLTDVADLILKHHENYNGSGYPLGLKEDAIPVECRILSIAIAYSAMTNPRAYADRLSHKEALAELKRCAGSQLDPEVVEVFVEMMA